MTETPSTPLVSQEWLAEHLDDPNIVILECAWAEPDAAEYFAEGHIPGSHYVWWKDISWDDSDRQFPDSATMASRLEAFGVSDDSTLVLVGAPIQFGTYVYWAIVMAGLGRLAVVVDGGRETWVAEGRPLTDDVPPTPAKGSITPGTEDHSSRLGRDNVLEHLEDPNRVMLDVRSPEEYSGERVSPYRVPFDHGAQRKGRIPGAVHLYYMDLLDETGRFKTSEQLAARFEEAGASTDKDAVAYCRLSHRATMTWFAAGVVAKRKNVRIYDGSWTEWGTIVGFPVEK